MADAQGITVGVRLRPFVGHEKGQLQALRINGNTVSIVTEVASEVNAAKGYGNDAVEAKSFTFDHALDSSDPSSALFVSQEKCYNRMARSMVKYVFEGFSTCLFCYGQTGTGKTMTIMGIIESESEQGLLVRLLNDVFKEVEDRKSSGNTFEVKVQIIEVYNEKIQDLLRDDKEVVKKLDVHMHPKLGVYLKDVQEETVESFERCVELINYGNDMKTVAATLMNANSSRGHTVFKMKLEKRDGSNVVESEVFFVDLAGRENEKTTKVSGDRFIELSFINKSLMWLANCIKQLGQMQVAKNKNPDAPPARTDMSKFRNSKLTMLLSNALSGNSKTSMIGTLSPAGAHFEESVSTLKFASTVKSIKLEATAKTGLDGAASAKLIADLQAEIRLLKDQLEDVNLRNPGELIRAESQGSVAIDGAAAMTVSEELQRQLEAAQAMEGEAVRFQERLEAEQAKAAELQRQLEEEQAAAADLQRKFEEEHTEALYHQRKWEEERDQGMKLQKQVDQGQAEAQDLQVAVETEHAEAVGLRKKLEDEHAHAVELEEKQKVARSSLVISRFNLAVSHSKLQRAMLSIKSQGGLASISEGGQEAGDPFKDIVKQQAATIARLHQEVSTLQAAPNDESNPARRTGKATASPGKVTALPGKQPAAVQPQECVRCKAAEAAESAATAALAKKPSSEMTLKEIDALRQELECSRQLCSEYRNKWEHEQEASASLDSKRRESVAQVVCLRFQLATARAKLARAGPLAANLGEVAKLGEGFLNEVESLGPETFACLGKLQLSDSADGQKTLTIPRPSAIVNTSSRPSVSVSSAVPMRGLLLKKSPSMLRVMNAWDPRYITLISGRLSWMNDAGGEVSGYVDLPLNACTVEVILGSSTQFGLHVQGGTGRFTNLGGTGVRTFVFDSEGSQFTRFEWMAGIKEHMKLQLDSDSNAWEREILSSGSLKLLSGRWLFLKPGGLNGVADRREELPPEAFVDPAVAAKLYRDCGCLVVMT